MKIFTVYLILIAFVQIDSEIFDNDQKKYLEKGLKAEQEGNPQEALEIWQQAAGALQHPSVEIAAEYLRVATQYQLSDYYRSASAIFNWGMSGLSEQDVKNNYKALKNELAHLKLIATKGEIEFWEKLLEEDNPAIFEEIRLFWERMDPTPATLYNERLIEHWLRITYARENFTRRNDPPIGTDKRGPVYVQYGNPDRIFNGRINLNKGEVNRVITDFFTTSTRLAAQGISNSLRAYMDAIENAVMDYYYSTNNDYEIWIYDSPNDEMESNIVRIFAAKSEGGFDLLDTIDEMIPARAFSASNRHAYQSLGGTVDFGLTPGVIMQWLYYSKLSTADPYFARSFSNINSELFSIQNDATVGMKHLGGTLKQENRHIARQIQNTAPNEFSTEEKALPDIPLEVYQYRFLDQNNRPYFVTFLESQPLDPFISDFSANQDVMSETEEMEEVMLADIFNFYNLTHGLQLRDERWQLLSQNRQPVSLVIDPDENSPSSSVFVIPYISNNVTQVFYAELENNHPNSKPTINTIFPDKLRGLGRKNINQPEALTVLENELLVSDLVLGYQKAEQPIDDAFFNFVVSNNRVIPEGENLVVHFEAYELQTNNDGISKFEVTYEIRPRGGLFAWTKKQRDEFNITLSFEHDDKRFAESLEIEVAELEGGKYDLIFVIHDLLSGQEQKREVSFEVS
ncbi:MAG: GWxTD domain-containing protein [Balneolaceae bacterium]